MESKEVNFIQFNPTLEVYDTTYVRPRTNHINIINNLSANRMRSFRSDKKAELSQEYMNEINKKYESKQDDNLTLDVPSDSKQFIDIINRLGRLNGLVSKSKNEELKKLVVTPEEFKQAINDKFYEVEAIIAKREDSKNEELIKLTKQLLEHTREKNEKLEILETTTQKDEELMDLTAQLLEYTKEKDSKIKTLETTTQKDEELMNLTKQLLENTKEKDSEVSKLEEENNNLKLKLQQQQLLNQKLYLALNQSENIVLEEESQKTM